MIFSVHVDTLNHTFNTQHVETVLLFKVKTPSVVATVVCIYNCLDTAKLNIQ